MSKLPPDLKPHEVLNVNVGVLGHVDSGKTSLVKALSTLLSTASLDKNPQSIARGITLDLGFSAFLLPLPARLESQLAAAATASASPEAATPAPPPFRALQFTLVDCPGHASLNRRVPSDWRNLHQAPHRGAQQGAPHP
jgi:selenocysteine-specific elongation factor